MTSTVESKYLPEVGLPTLSPRQEVPKTGCGGERDSFSDCGCNKKVTRDAVK